MDWNAVQDSIDFEAINPFDSERIIFDDDFYCDDDIPRYMHVDLGLKHDAIGISMTHVSDFKKIKILDTDVVTEVDMPFFKFDFVGKIKATGGEELFIADVRELIIHEIVRRGFNLKIVTFDRFASLETSQLLVNEGFAVGSLSLDRTTSAIFVDYSRPMKTRSESTKGNYLAAWSAYKDAITDRRIKIPYLPDYEEEAKHAERRIKGARVTIDCQSSALSLDLLESIAGSVFNAMNNEKNYILNEDDIVNDADRKAALFYSNIGQGEESFYAEQDDRSFYDEGSDFL